MFTYVIKYGKVRANTCYFNSRPKKLSDVSAQDHAVSVLTRTIQSNNVSDASIDGTIANHTASSYAFLRPTRHWQNLHDPGPC